MAIIKSPFGTITGTCGDYVYRATCNGNVQSAKPKSFETPMDEDSVSRRRKFKFVIQLAAAVTKLFSLRIYWLNQGKRKSKCLTKVYKHIYPQVNLDLSFPYIDLIQHDVFSLTNPQILFEKDEIKISIDPLGVNQVIDNLQGVKISAEGVICLSSTEDESLQEFTFIPVCSADKELSLTSQLCFTLPISDNDVQLAKHYKTKHVLLILITKQKDGRPVQYSGTNLFQ